MKGTVTRTNIHTPKKHTPKKHTPKKYTLKKHTEKKQTKNNNQKNINKSKNKKVPEISTLPKDDPNYSREKNKYDKPIASREYIINLIDSCDDKF